MIFVRDPSANIAWSSGLAPAIERVDGFGVALVVYEEETHALKELARGVPEPSAQMLVKSVSKEEVFAYTKPDEKTSWPRLAAVLHKSDGQVVALA